MEVTYKESDGYYGKEEETTQSVETFLYKNILTIAPYNYKDSPIRLEEQGSAVIKAMGRLISILLDKEVLNLDDLKEIVENYDETLELKKYK